MSTCDLKEDREGHVMSIFKEIRSKILNELKSIFVENIIEGAETCDIEWLHNQTTDITKIPHDKNKYMGYCAIYHNNWKHVNEYRKISDDYVVEKIIICLYDDNNNIVPMSDLISVFLHELAHSVTCGIMEYDKDIKQWKEIDHSHQFYDNYEKILRISEKLNIFNLPKIPNKYSINNLKRFDNIDTNYIPLPSYVTQFKHLDLNGKAITTIRLMIRYENITKIITIDKNKTEKKTENEIENKIENETENKIENETENKIENKTKNKTEVINLIDLWNLIYNKITLLKKIKKKRKKIIAITVLRQ